MSQIIFFKTDNTGCGHYRCEVPAKILRNAGYSCDVRYVNPAFRAYPETKLVFIQRHYIFIDVPILLRKFKRHNIKIIYDLDDDFFNLTPDSSLHRIRANLLKEIKLLASFADVMTVSTKSLKELYTRIFDREIQVIPNLVDKSFWGPLAIVSPHDRIRVGWAGSPTHYKDLMQFYPVFRKIIEERKDIDFVFFGYCPREFLDSGGKRVEFHPTGPFDKYAKTLPNLRIDIGIIPSIATSFNNSKSIIKFLEYSVAGIPSIISNVKPYTSVAVNALNCLLVSSEQAWFEKICYLADHPEARLKLLHGTSALLEDFSIQKGSSLWASLVNNLIISDN